jgi:hypothetical protein
MYDENVNNVFENVDKLEQVVQFRVKVCGVRNEGAVARIADKLIDILREIQTEFGPLSSTDNYEEVLMSYLYVLGGEIDGDNILTKVAEAKDTLK